MASYYTEQVSDSSTYWFTTYWEPPRIKIQVEWAGLDYGPVDGSATTRNYIVHGIKVAVSGGLNKVNIRTDGLEEEIKQAIEKIIKSREIKEDENELHTEPQRP